MNDLKSRQELLQKFLENAARSGETACVSHNNLQTAQKIVSDNSLNVSIYVIPAPEPKPL